MLTQPKDIEFEKFCLRKYLELLKWLKGKHERLSTLETDLSMLDEKTEVDLQLTDNQRFAVVYRSEKKKIIRSQIEIATYLLQVIEDSY